MHVIWFKKDLRLRDNAALEAVASHAAIYEQTQAILPLYVHEPSLVARADCSRQHTEFLVECLADLRAELASFGATLVERVGEVVDELERLHQVYPFQSLWAHQESGHEGSFARDRAVRAWCQSRYVIFHELPQNGVLRGSEFRRKGHHWQTYLEDACSTNLFEPTAEIAWVPADAPVHASFPSCAAADVPHGAGVDKPHRQRGGRRAALARLDAFFDTPEALSAYPKSISSPLTAVDGCTRMSAYLTFGVVSDREVIQALNTVVERSSTRMREWQHKQLRSSARFLSDRMMWRSAYLQTFETRIATEHTNDLAVFDGVRELDDERLRAWSEGRTGYPMIDATMRMLAATGWINMRARGMVVSFAVNELWLPWREVGLHLAREFLDYEPGIHWPQHQIHAGTSRLSPPLAYNAVKQARDHDPQGEFVRRWVPELRDVPLELLFEPWEMSATAQRACGCMIGFDYPAPLVDHRAAAERARRTVYALRDGKPVPPPKVAVARPQAPSAAQAELF